MDLQTGKYSMKNLFHGNNYYCSFSQSTTNQFNSIKNGKHEK